jgi:hypothetical protein
MQWPFRLCGTFARKGHEGLSSFSVLRETPMTSAIHFKKLKGYGMSPRGASQMKDARILLVDDEVLLPTIYPNSYLGEDTR